MKVTTPKKNFASSIPIRNALKLHKLSTVIFNYESTDKKLYIITVIWITVIKIKIIPNKISVFRSIK